MPAQRQPSTVWSRRVSPDVTAAAILLLAAGLGLLAANSAAHNAFANLLETTIPLPRLNEANGETGISIHHLISDGLLAVFFFTATVELRHELTHGHLNSLRTALRPAIAALGGVVLPAMIYLAFTAGGPYQGGWPIPTATDIAFALGILALFGKGIHPRVRAFVLALAVLDDIVGILVIAFLFSSNINLGELGLALAAVIVFGIASRLSAGRMRAIVVPLVVVAALAAWYFTHLSGVHATIAGVALGIAMAPEPARRAHDSLAPTVAFVVLPLFAFTAAFVVIPSIAVTELAAPFWAILVALLVGKLVGISVAGWLAGRRVADAESRLTPAELITAGALGGVGFTVSLLVTGLAFADHPDIADQGTVAVLLASGLAIVAGSALTWRLSLRGTSGAEGVPNRS